MPARSHLAGRAALVALAALPLAAAAAVASTTFSTGISPRAEPFQITAGADGNLWFTEDAGGRVARLTPGGVVTEFPVSAGARPAGIALGQDGNLWFTEFGAGAIGYVTPAGRVTELAGRLTPGARPLGIAAGPDQALWFVEYDGRVGRVDLSGQVREFPTPSSGLRGIAAGPDGNLWYTAEQPAAIGRITPQGAITEFTAGLRSGADPEAIVAGPDGNLWFTEFEAGGVGRVTPAGQIQELSGVSRGAQPFTIAPGRDGNLWFVENGGALGRVTVAGAVTEYLDAGKPFRYPDGIVTGPDGALWYTERDGNRIGRIEPAGLVPRLRSLGVRLSGKLALRATLSDPAVVTLSVRRADRGKLQRVARRSAAAGTLTLRWNGRLAGHRAAPGRYVLTLSASGGGATLTRSLRVQVR